jgi:chromosome segregation ATPase
MYVPHPVSKLLRITNTKITDTALADHTAQLLRQQPQPASKPASPSPQSSQIPTSKERTGTPTKGSKEAESTTAASDLLSTLRADLSATQKARATLQAQLSDLTTQLSALSTQQKVSQSQITTLSKQVLDAERKLHDRDEELRGKSKMVEQAQDEMVALELQFNLAEQRSEKLERENKELVERWMKRMGEEAEKVNRDSRWE